MKSRMREGYSHYSSGNTEAENVARETTEQGVGLVRILRKFGFQLWDSKDMGAVRYYVKIEPERAEQLRGKRLWTAFPQEDRLTIETIQTPKDSHITLTFWILNLLPTIEAHLKQKKISSKYFKLERLHVA